MAPTQDFIRYPAAFSAFYRKRFQDITHREPASGADLEGIVNRVIPAFGYPVASEVLILGLLVELSSNSLYGAGETVLHFSDHANLTEDQARHLYPGAVCEHGRWYVGLESGHSPERVNQVAREFVHYLAATAEALLRVSVECTPFIRSKLRKLGDNSVRALYSDYEMEALVNSLVDSSHLEAMRVNACGKLATQNPEEVGYARTPLSRAEREQLTHRVLVGLPFEDALRNLVWRRYLQSNPQGPAI